MSRLEDQSELYRKLSKKYEEKNSKDISLSLFSDCVDIASKASSKEIRFVLFKMKCLYDDVDSDFDKVNIITKVLKFLAGDSMKGQFMIAVLEAALDEK